MTRWLNQTHGPDFELVRHFFVGLFESDLFASRERLQTLLVSAFSLVAGFGLVLPLLFNHKYHALNALPSPVLFHQAALADKLMFLTLAFVVTAFVTALQYQSLFPAPLDFLILVPLPLRLGQIFRAKFAALLLFMTLLIVGTNILPAISLPGVMAGRWQTPNGSLLHVFSLLASFCLGGYFVFFSLMAVQGFELALLPPRWFRWCSLWTQAVLLLVLATLFPLLFWIPNLHALMTARPPAALWLPPAWFLGWEQTMLGSPDPFASALAFRAKFAFVTSLMACLAAYGLAYSRGTNQLLETTPRLSQRRWRLFSSVVASRLFSEMSEFAVFVFAVKTLARSRPHKLILCALAGASVALAVDGFLSLVISASLARHPVHYRRIEQAAFTAPLVVSFFLLCGIRYLFRIPVEVRANWIFQLTIGHASDAAVDAAEKSLLLMVACPVAALSFFALAPWLGWRTALLHSSLVFLLSVVLLEALLWNWDKIPFTCPYLPAKRNVIQTGLLFGIALAFFAYGSAALEIAALPSAARTLFLFGSLLSAAAFLRFHRKKSWHGCTPLAFDDVPEPEVHTLQLEPE